MEPVWTIRNLCTKEDFHVDKPVMTVGRHKSHDLTCLNFAVSRRHAILLVEEGVLYVQSCQSVNGTWVNRRRLGDDEKVKLSDTDFLSFGYSEHPDCGEGDNHYYYRVMLRNVPINSSADLLRILEGEDLDVTSDIKKEPEDPQPPIIEYSHNEEVIIIDDEDDFEFASSQIFKENSIIKAEPIESIEISDDEADQILKLIRLLSPIEECFEDGQATGDELPSSNENSKGDDTQHIPPNDHEKHDVDINDVCMQEVLKETNKEMNDNQQDENQNLILEDGGQNGTINDICLEVPKEVNTNENENQINEENSKSKTIVDRSFIVKTKYSKPTVISPHIKKRRKSISKEEKNDVKKQKVEDQPSHEENVKNTGKQKSTRSRGRPRKNPEKANVDPQVNEEKSAHTKESMDIDPPLNKRRSTRNKQNADINPAINGRGNTSRDTSSKLKNITSKSLETKENNSLESGNKSIVPLAKQYPLRNGLIQKNGFNKRSITEPNIQSNEITIALSRVLETSMRPTKMSFRNLEYCEPSTSNTVTTLKDPRLRNGTYNGIKNVPNERVVNNNDLEGILRCHVNHNVRSKPESLKNQYTFLAKPSASIIFSILTWNSRWLQEQQEQSVPPPIIRNDVVKMCTRFNTYGDYCNVVKPFITLELWDNLSQGFQLSGFGNHGFRTSICEVRKFSTYQILKCVAYTSDKDRRLTNRPKEGDVIIINVGVRPRPNAKQAAVKCMFAFVVSCRCCWLKPTDYIYKDLLSNNNDISMQLDIHLLLKPFSEEILLAKFVDATIISSVTSILRECDAVTYMEKSSISKLILNPKIENFCVQRNNNLAIEKINLSDKQFMAISDACSLCVGNKPGLYMIQGPPGTGKTTVIQHIVENLVRAKDHIRILVVAPSNSTVDGIVRKLGIMKNHGKSKARKATGAREAYRPDMVRVGIYDSVSNDLKHYFLDSIAKRRIVHQLLQERPEVKMDYNNLKQRRNDLYMKLEKDKQSGSKSKVDQLYKELQFVDQQLNNFATDYWIESHYKATLLRTKRDIMLRAKIICTTLNSCIRLDEYDMNIDCCIVDEASQSKETETLIPLGLGIQKMVLVGDPQQLPAVTLSKFAKDLEYGQSLFARMKKAFALNDTEPITVLDTQFRMHPEICLYPNKMFYNGVLKTAPQCNNRGGLDGLVPYYVLNLILKDKQVDVYNNRYEIDCVIKLLESIHTTLIHKPDRYYTVGVITPYNSQKKDLLLQIEKLRLPKVHITVNTVDSFQGSEKDIIILSCVRARANSFLDDKQRLNVALTRARRVLYVVGTNPLFDSCPTLKNLKSNAESRNLYLNVYDVSISNFKSLIEKKRK